MLESLEQKSEFDEIRPFYDEEVNEIVQTLVSNPFFIKFFKYLFPERDDDFLKDLLKDVASVSEFQKRLMYPAANVIIERSVGSVSHAGIDTLEKQKSYLFVSNHRDIILDSALLNVMLYEQGLDTCEVAIGSNLLSSPWIKTLVRLNRNFIVHRDVPPKQLYAYSLRLSRYIRQALVEKKIVCLACSKRRAD